MSEWRHQFTYLNIIVSKAGSLERIMTISLAFWSPSLLRTFCLLEMIFATRCFGESPGGFLFQVVWSKSGRRWVFPRLSASRQCVSTPVGTLGAPSGPCVLAVHVTRWEGDRSPLGFIVGRLPSRVAWATYPYISFPGEIPYKWLMLPSTPCPIRTRPWVKFGTRLGDKSNRHRLVFIFMPPLSVPGLESMCLHLSFLRKKYYPKCTSLLPLLHTLLQQRNSRLSVSYARAHLTVCRSFTTD